MWFTYGVFDGSVESPSDGKTAAVKGGEPEQLQQLQEGTTAAVRKSGDLTLVEGDIATDKEEVIMTCKPGSNK